MKRILVMLVALVIVGCGQSGPLYIPGNPSRIENPPAPPEEAAEDEAGEENGDSDTDKG